MPIIRNKVINCSNFDPNGYFMEIKPDILITYRHNDVPWKPIFQTDWIEIDADDIKDEYICITNDSTKKNIN